MNRIRKISIQRLKHRGNLHRKKLQLKGVRQL